MERYLKHIKKNTLNFTELRKRFYAISVYGDFIKLQGNIKDADIKDWSMRRVRDDIFYDKEIKHEGHSIEICLTN